MIAALRQSRIFRFRFRLPGFRPTFAVMSTIKTSTERKPRQSTRLAGAPRRPRKRQERRDEILDAAAALFVEKGRSSTSIDDIAERASVAKGTLYHYFPDRAAMLAALRDRYSLQFRDLAAEAMGKCEPQDWQGRLSAWTSTVVHEYVSQQELLDVIYHEPSVRDRSVLSREPVVQILSELIEQGNEAGEWRAEDSTAAGVCMFQSMLGLAGDVIATGGDTNRVAPLLSQLFWNMLHPA